MSTQDAINAILINTIEQIGVLDVDGTTGRVLVETRAGIRPTKGFYVGIWWQSIEALPDYTGDAEYYENIDEELIERRHFMSKVNIRLTGYGELAYQKMLILRVALDSDARFTDLWQIIGFAGTSEVQDISTEWQGVIHQRAYFDFYFYACLGNDFNADYFTKGKFNINNSGDEILPRRRFDKNGCGRMS